MDAVEAAALAMEGAAAEAAVLAASAAEVPAGAAPAVTIEETECKTELLQRRARPIRLRMIQYSRTCQPETTSNPKREEIEKT